MIKKNGIDLHVKYSGIILRKLELSGQIFFFIVAPCILIFTQFIHQQMHIY